MRLRILGLGMLAAGCLAVSPARAGVFVVSGSGTWGAGTETTQVSAVGDTFSFSFDISSPFTGTTTGIGIRTYAATNFSFELNGSAVAVGLTDVAFYTPTDDGGFDLVLSDGVTLSAFGQAFGYTGTLTPTDISENFAANAPDSFPNGSGTGTVSVTPAVPEPISLALLGTGLLGLLSVRRQAKMR
jgi:hypothetical protein